MRLILITAVALLAAGCEPKPPAAQTVGQLCNAPFPPYWRQGSLHLLPWQDFAVISVARSGKISWNDLEASVADVRSYLVQARDKRLLIRLEYEKGTPCGPIVEVRQAMEELVPCLGGKRSGQCQFGHGAPAGPPA